MIDWTHWHNEPLLLGGLILLGWLYAVLAGPWRERLACRVDASAKAGGIAVIPPYPVGHAIKFYGALVIFYLAVGSPLDQAGERFLLSAHMLQHQLMIYPSAIFFLLGLPDWMVRPITSYPPIQGLLRFLTKPLICGLVFCVGLQVWHLPLLYDAALQNRNIHILEHFTFFGSALFLWWPVCSPSTEFPPAKYATQMFYFVAVTIGMKPAFAYITFSQDILYPTYEYAPRITWMSAADDQLLAGSMMALVGMVVLMGAFAISFYRWYQQTEGRSGQKKGGPKSA